MTLENDNSDVEDDEKYISSDSEEDWFFEIGQQESNIIESPKFDDGFHMVCIWLLFFEIISILRMIPAVSNVELKKTFRGFFFVHSLINLDLIVCKLWV